MNLRKAITALTLITLLGCSHSAERAQEWREACEAGAGIISDRDAIYEYAEHLGGGYSRTLKASWITNVPGMGYCEVLCAKKFGKVECVRHPSNEVAYDYFNYVFRDEIGLVASDWIPHRRMIQRIRKVYDEESRAKR